MHTVLQNRILQVLRSEKQLSGYFAHFLSLSIAILQYINMKQCTLALSIEQNVEAEQYIR